MIIIIILLAVWLFSLFLTPYKIEEKKECTIHNWAVNEQANVLQCTKCKYVAGSE